MDRSPHLQRLEMEAYTAVLRALAATPMDWVRRVLVLAVLSPAADICTLFAPAAYDVRTGYKHVLLMARSKRSG